MPTHVVKTIHSAAHDFAGLVDAIYTTDEFISAQVGKAVNVALTLRNWFIGLHIAEYELHGVDRAVYGENLLSALSERLTRRKVSNCNRGNSIVIFCFIGSTLRLCGHCPHN